jgi:hypothetical protein
VAIATAIRDLTVTIQQNEDVDQKMSQRQLASVNMMFENIYVSHFLQRYMRGHAYTETQT